MVVLVVLPALLVEAAEVVARLPLALMGLAVRAETAETDRRTV
jgi:hypothetical protein